jgi:Putative peptidoglycan binding domain
MSTQYYTDDRPATSQPDPGNRAPRPGNQGPSWYRIWAIVIGTIVAAALIVLAAVGLTHNHATATTPAAAAPTPTSAPAASAARSAPASPAQPTTPASPAVAPSASVKKLQQELGQLNYYEGPVDGLMGPQTAAAITDLQRQAGLPQTGTMNPATQAALNYYLVHGNNQMAG